MMIGAEPSSEGIFIRVISEGAGTLSGMQYVRDAARQNAYFYHAGLLFPEVFIFYDISLCLVLWVNPSIPYTRLTLKLWQILKESAVNIGSSFATLNGVVLSIDILAFVFSPEVPVFRRGTSSASRRPYHC